MRYMGGLQLGDRHFANGHSKPVLPFGDSDDQFDRPYSRWRWWGWTVWCWSCAFIKRLQHVITLNNFQNILGLPECHWVVKQIQGRLVVKRVEQFCTRLNLACHSSVANQVHMSAYMTSPIHGSVTTSQGPRLQPLSR